MLFGNGNPKATIMFVVDDIPKGDLRDGKIFSGNNERMLREQLASVGYEFANTYRTAFIKDHVPGLHRKFIKEKELRAELQEFHAKEDYGKWLMQEINDVLPNVIVPMGDLSLEFLTGNKSLERFRGSILNLREGSKPLYKKQQTRIIPTFSIQHINEVYERRFIQRLDLEKKIIPQSEKNTPHFEHAKLWLPDTYEQAWDFFDRHKNAPFMVFDIENLKYGILDCIGFCFSDHEAIALRLLDKRVPENHRIGFFNLARTALMSPVPKVNQNIKYDLTQAERFFQCEIPNVVGDTMYAAHCLYPEFDKNLGFLVSLYTHMPYFKDEGKNFDATKGDWNQRGLYCAKDTLGTRRVYVAQMAELQEDGIKDFYDNFKMPLLGLYRDIDRAGFRICEDTRSDLRRKYERIYSQTNETLQSLIPSGEKLNINSPPQCQALAYDILKFKEQKNKEGNRTAGGDVLEELLVNYRDNILGETGCLILEHIVFLRKISQVLKFIDLGTHPDGRLYTTYSVCGTKFGRTSSKQTIDRSYFLDKDGKLDWKTLGVAIQQLPKHGVDTNFLSQFEKDPETGKGYGWDIRKMFVCDPGWVFIDVDQSQAEARHVAVLAEDWTLLKLFDETDIHNVTASWVLGKPVDQITKTERQNFGKPARHAGNYDMTAYMMSQQYHMHINICQNTLNKFHENSPNIRRVFHNDVRNEVRRNMMLTNPFGRRILLLGRPDDKYYKECYAAIPQGTVSDQSKRAMLSMRDKVAKDEYLKKYRFIYENHDGIMASVREDFAEDFMLRLKPEMEAPIDYRKCSIPRDIDLVVPSEFGVSSTNWLELKDLVFVDGKFKEKGK